MVLTSKIEVRIVQVRIIFKFLR